MVDVLRENVPWSCLKGVMSLLRLRSGLVTLSHRNGVRSQARMQQCVCCFSECVTDVYLHVLLCCSLFTELREAVFSVIGRPNRLNREALYIFLNTKPSHHGFEKVVALCVAVDSHARCFWELRANA